MESQPHSPSSLRARAEAAAQWRHNELRNLSPAEVQRLVHELEVQQIELEMQNAELRQTQVELAESRDRFSNLYDFAPVGYVTLDLMGAVLEANLTAAKMLGVTRQELVGQPLSRFLTPDSQDDLYRYRQSIFGTETSQACDLKLRRADGSSLPVHVEGARFGDDPQGRRCLAAFLDISALRRVEAELRASNTELARFNETMVGRELRMIELKQEINELCRRAGQPLRYPLAGEKRPAAPG